MPEKNCPPDQGRMSYSGSAFLMTGPTVNTRLFAAAESSLEIKLV